MTTTLVAASITATSTYPLTTTFTPPSGCIQNSWTYEAQYYNSFSNGLLIQNVLSSGIPSTCFPPYFNGNGRAPTGVLNVYSPAACPSGYTTVQQNVVSSAGMSTVRTEAVCCYEGFSYLSTLSQGFGSAVVTSSYEGCISAFSGTTTVSGRSGTSLNTTSISIPTNLPITMWAQALRVQHDASDMSLFTTTTAASSSNTNILATTGASGSSAVASPTSSATGTTSTSNTSGLSTGAKTGIGIGIALAVIAAITTGVFIFSRRRRRQQVQQHPQQHGAEKQDLLSPRRAKGGAQQEYSTELPVHSHVSNYGRSELDAQNLVEMPAGQAPGSRMYR